jgi:hypothetical protein
MPNEVTVLVSVSLVESGGNTGGGKYFYSFTPALLHIDNGPAILTYQFCPDTAAHYEMVGVYTCDARNQVGEPKVADDRRSVTMRHFNTIGQLALLSFLVKDSSTNTYLSCDPQVTNDPGRTS